MALDIQSINLGPDVPLKIESIENGTYSEDVSVTSVNIPGSVVVDMDRPFGTHLREAVEIVKDWMHER